MLASKLKVPPIPQLVRSIRRLSTSPHLQRSHKPYLSSKRGDDDDQRSSSKKASYGNGSHAMRRAHAVPTPSYISAEAVQSKLENLLTTIWLPHGAPLRQIATQFALNAAQFRSLTSTFAKQSLDELQAAGGSRKVGWDLRALQSDFVAGGHDALQNSAVRMFLQWCHQQPLPALPLSFPASLHPLFKLHRIALATDLRHPGELFPEARQIRRKIILHVGPTNSGKTHRALVALARARTGVYAGPLRLLAHEVFSRFNQGKVGDEGVRVCNLVTGEEQRIIDPNAALESCTVEMFPLTRKVAVGVIDEIQMIGDPQRGTAWTNAVIGSQCEELHLCGEESVVELIQTIARELGDECVVNRYQRLSPLGVAEKSLESDISRVKKGDCLVTFSRNNIFAFKRFVEDKTGLRVAVAYGGLPPEVREEQARAFNEGDYDVLVASDAVGMGLNLKINRIVFETLHKWDGKAEVQLSMPQIKQIAGRAGRFGVHSSPTAPDDDDASTNTTIGEVTTLDESDMDLLREAIAAPVIQVTQAVISPSTDCTRLVHNLSPASTSQSATLSFVNNAARTAPHYLARRENDRQVLTEAIEHVQPLSFEERTVLALAPVNTRDPKAYSSLVQFAESFARGEQILVAKWADEVGLRALLHRVAKEEARSQRAQDNSDAIYPGSDRAIFTPTQLAELESFHRCLTTYLWLAYRLPDVFCDMTSARSTRKEVEKAIDFTLAGIKFQRIERKANRQSRGLMHWSESTDRQAVEASV